MTPRSACRSAVRVLVAVAAIGVVGPPALAQSAPQVTLFGVLATPGEKTVDKDLAAVAAQLRKLLPDHGFKHLGSRSRPLAPGQEVEVVFGGGWSASLQMILPIDADGKVQMKYTVHHEGEPSFQRIIRTPPNQLFFGDVALPDGRRLVMGMGAR